MASLGSVNFSILRGVPSLIRQRVQTWEVPGLDGIGAQTLGKGDGEFSVTGIGYWASSAEANAHIEACADLQGTAITMTDDWGGTTDGVLVKHVYIDGPIKRAVLYLGNPSAIRTEILFDLVATQ